MNEVCYANEGDSQKERTWRPLLLQAALTAAIHLLPHPLLTQFGLFRRGGGDVARHFSSYFMVNASALAFKAYSKGLT